MVGGCIKAEGNCEYGATVKKTLKAGGTEKRGREAKILKKGGGGGGQAGTRGGCLKKGGGDGIPLQTMDIYLTIYRFIQVLWEGSYLYTYDVVNNTHLQNTNF